MCRPPLLVLATCAAAAVLAPNALASTPFRPCRSAPRVECARVDVPLDRSGTVPGTIPLHAERLRARRAARGVVIAIAGGPGQATAPYREEFAAELEPVLRNHDLVLIDQRGSGSSALLRCPELERPATGLLARAVKACAAALGARRHFYTTLDAADDIEAVRQVLGAEKVSLYGVSYGTKLALAYASRYPSRVERLLLDSVLPLDGPDPFMRDVFVAVPRVMRALCAGGACRGITRDPVTDIAALVSQLARAPILSTVIGGDGRPHPRRLGRLRLLNILFAGDLDPSFRAELPAAVRATLNGDRAPLMRLAHRATVLNYEEQLEPPELFSTALFVATSCEDGPLPWQPLAPFSDRWGQAISRAGSIPDPAFYPFDRPTGRASDALRLCAHWPAAAIQRPLPLGALPNVPTLMLSGEADLRTPHEGALRLSRQLPRATLLMLPGTGHSVLGSDLSFCAADAVKRFFADRPVRRSCSRVGQFVRELFSSLFLPTPLPPRALATVRRSPGIAGRPGRTVTAFQLTLADAFLQQLYWCPSDPCRARRIGGLRGGRIRAAGSLDSYSYVPGVEVSDTSKKATLLDGPRVQRFLVGGAAASKGMLALDYRKLVLRGRLGGKRVRIDLLAQLKRQFGEEIERLERDSPPSDGSERCCRFSN